MVNMNNVIQSGFVFKLGGSLKFAMVLIAACAALAATAAPNDAKSDVKVATLDDARCKKEVAQYLEALQFVRQSAGDEVGAKVMANYVPVGQLNQVVTTSGYCAGAQMLRDKRATK
jgi:hypothetical protein